MADFDYPRSTHFRNIPDDSPFVHQAMHILGFTCEFHDLTTAQMQDALVVALYLKVKQGQTTLDPWES